MLRCPSVRGPLPRCVACSMGVRKVAPALRQAVQPNRVFYAGAEARFASLLRAYGRGRHGSVGSWRLGGDCRVSSFVGASWVDAGCDLAGTPL